MPRVISVLAAWTVLAGWWVVGQMPAAVGVETGAQPQPLGAGPVLFPLSPPYLGQPLAEPSANEADDEQEEEKQERKAGESTDTKPAQEGPNASQPQPPAAAEAAPKRQLTPAMTALRDRVRRTLASYRRPLLTARDNTATEIMYACLAFGCDTDISRDGSPQAQLNGITCLCWNYPCAGYELFTRAGDHFAARIGYALQEQPSQMLAVLAMARVKPTYPVRVGEDVRSVADLVEYEKLSCRSGEELSLKLIGLSHYVDEPAWQNSLGETWSVERIVQEELARPILTARDGGTQRLLGFSYAVCRRELHKQAVEGQYLRAKKLVEDFHEYALQLANRDGSWGPQYLAAASSTRDAAVQLRATGRILEWLAVSLPEQRLEDPRVVRAVECVNTLLGGNRYTNNLKTLPTREIGSVMHALHALTVYDQRVFRNSPIPAIPNSQFPTIPGTHN